MKNKLMNYITEQVSEDFSDDELDVHDDLLGSGLLDSLGMMRLIQFIETEFNITVPPEDMTIENFMTVSYICNYIENQETHL